jgi:hypothetical protein
MTENVSGHFNGTPLFALSLDLLVRIGGADLGADLIPANLPLTLLGQVALPLVRTPARA